MECLLVVFGKWKPHVVLAEKYFRLSFATISFTGVESITLPWT
jgi:hypothetical protein